MLTKVQVTVGFVSGVIATKLLNYKRKHTYKDVIEDVRTIYAIDISIQQVWRAKERAIEMIRDKPADEYEYLPKCLYMLNEVYPNSYIRMHKSEKNEFMYLFIALRPLMRGFQHCRPITVVDSAHLSRAYRGIFVTTSTLMGQYSCKNREIASYTKKTLGRKFEEVLLANASK